MKLRSFGLHTVALKDVELPTKRLGIFIEATADELEAIEQLLQERLGKTVGLHNPETDVSVLDELTAEAQRLGLGYENE